MALVHRHRERAYLPLVVDGKRRVRHRPVHVAAEHGGGHVAGPFERHIRGLHAEGRIQTLVGRVIGRVLARATQRELAGIRLGGLHEILERLEGTLLTHHQRIRRVMEPEHGRDVVGLVLHLALDGLKHDVWKVDTDDVEPVAGELVHLRPHQAASCTRLVLNDAIDRGAVLFQHDLLVARGDIRLAPRRERLPVGDVLVGAGLRQNGRRSHNGEQCHELVHESSHPRHRGVDPVRRRTRRR